MFKKLLVSLILLLSLPAQAELVLSPGVGKGIFDVHGTPFERVAFVGYQYNYNRNVFVRPEVGYFNSNSYGDSSLFVAPLAGIKVITPSGLYTHIAIGPGYLQNPDRVLGGHFQFSLEGYVGLTDKKFSIGVAYKHLSSGGIEVPNNGRDFVCLQLGIKGL